MILSIFDRAKLSYKNQIQNISAGRYTWRGNQFRYVLKSNCIFLKIWYDDNIMLTEKTELEDCT